MKSHPGTLWTPGHGAAVDEPSKRRLSVFDLLLMFVGYGLGAIYTPWVVMVSHEAAPTASNPQPIWIAAHRLATVLVMGAVLNGPLILLAHRVMGGWRRLSLGEGLWLTPFVFVGGFAIAWAVGSLLLFFLVCSALLVCSTMGVLNALANLMGFHDPTACRWTDLAGSVTCCSLLGWLLLDLNLFPVV